MDVWINFNLLVSFSCQYYRLICALFNDISRSGYRIMHSFEKLDDAWAIINVGEGRVRAQLSVAEQTLMVRRHVSAPMVGHHQVSKKVSYEETKQFGG
jgi:hypothetical protein